MAFSVVGTAFANATTITIPAHTAGDVIVIFAWRNDSATPPTRPSGWFALLSGASGTFSNQVGWAVAADSSTVSGTWTNATRLACVVVREGTIDEAVASQSGSSTSDDFYWGSDPFSAGRRVVLFGENNATYAGAAAHTTPSDNAAWTTIGSVSDQGSVIHLSDGLITSVDEFVSLTSSGGTAGYRTGMIAFVSENAGSANITLGGVTVTAAGTVPIVGAATPTLGAATLDAAGEVQAVVSGAATITLGAVTLDAAGDVGGIVSGDAAITLGATTLDATGVVFGDLAGELDVTLGALSLSASGGPVVVDTSWRAVTPTNAAQWDDIL